MKQTVRTDVPTDGNTQAKCVCKGRRSEAERPWYFTLRHAVVRHVLKTRRSGLCAGGLWRCEETARVTHL